MPRRAIRAVIPRGLRQAPLGCQSRHVHDGWTQPAHRSVASAQACGSIVQAGWSVNLSLDHRSLRLGVVEEVAASP
jgi:hypothetical protein